MIGLLLALLAPVTQAEAVAFHERGLCVMAAPGKGLTRADGRGWIGAYYPGPTRIYADAGEVDVDGGNTIDATPGKVYLIKTSTPGARIMWCPTFAQPGRNACGPVPSAFLYDAVTAK